jgi:hypothetical protein
MADTNFTALSGSVSKWGHTPPSGGMKWHRFWILTHLDNAQVQWGDQQVVIQDQKLFLGIKVGDSESQGKILYAVKERLGNPAGAYFIATDATIGSYYSKKKKQEVFELSVGLSNLRVFNEPRQPENLVVLCGRVTSVSPGWIQVEERYRNPRGQGADAWKSRKVWVYTAVQMDVQEGTQVYVRGKLANKTPDGQEMMYVIAEKIS